MTESTQATADRPFEAQRRFGPRLKAERERRGITLSSIAESTKIKESLLSALERNDLSKWPQGIFRRAHFCDYVTAIGLPSGPLLAEFLTLFPDESVLDAQKPADNAESASSDRPQTLRLRMSGLGGNNPLWSIAFDFAATMLLSSIAAAVLETDLLPTIAAVFLMYAAIAAACFGESLGSRLNRSLERADVSPAQLVANADRREPRVLVSAQQRSGRRQQTAA
jgi:transcriptional regulator with XRE-family HTH domain